MNFLRVFLTSTLFALAFGESVQAQIHTGGVVSIHFGGRQYHCHRTAHYVHHHPCYRHFRRQPVVRGTVIVGGTTHIKRDVRRGSPKCDGGVYDATLAKCRSATPTLIPPTEARRNAFENCPTELESKWVREGSRLVKYERCKPPG